MSISEHDRTAPSLRNEAAAVLEHADCGPGYRRLVLMTPGLAAAARPGQFAHLRVPGLEATALRRPISIFDADAHEGRLEFLYKVVGRGTAALAQAKPGETVEVLGPLGRGFPTACRGVPLLVGGGYGVAPLHFLARTLTASSLAKSRSEVEKRSRPEVEVENGISNLLSPPQASTSTFSPRLFVGGRTKDDLLALDRFAALGVETFAATNDGSFGTKGFAVVPLDAELRRLREAGEPFALFACGPDGLLKAVAERALSLGVPGWISCDRHMVCGVGACYACIQQTTKGPARCCVDGPVFRAEELVW